MDIERRDDDSRIFREMTRQETRPADYLKVKRDSRREAADSPRGERPRLDGRVESPPRVRAVICT
jgi:hypothetical protein